jgi:hypothetical protein
MSMSGIPWVEPDLFAEREYGVHLMTYWLGSRWADEGQELHGVGDTVLMMFEKAKKTVGKWLNDYRVHATSF